MIREHDLLIFAIEEVVLVLIEEIAVCVKVVHF